MVQYGHNGRVLARSSLWTLVLDGMNHASLLRTSLLMHPAGDLLATCRHQRAVVYLCEHTVAGLKHACLLGVSLLVHPVRQAHTRQAL